MSLRKIWSNPILAEPGRRFSRLEAWLYITNVLAAPIDDEADEADKTAGLKRGEFVGSVRKCAAHFHWSIGAVQRFFRILLQHSMIMRVEHKVEHFIVCNYETYSEPRYTPWNTGAAAEQEVEHLNICECRTSGEPRYTLQDSGTHGVYINNNFINNNKNKNKKDTHGPAQQDQGVSPKILFEIYQQHNQALPGVKALTAERLRKCRSRINQAVHDGCLEQYLADFIAAVRKAQSTPFLRGEGSRGWRASFDWLVANQVNVYAVLEGKYDGPATGPNHAYRGGNDHASSDGGGCRPSGIERRGPDARTSRGDPVYIPRQ